MLGYNAGTSPPTSTSALEYKFPTRMSKSDKHGGGRSRGSPFDRLKLEANEGTHKRSYSSGDVDPTGAPGPPGDESPSSPAPHTDRTRTFSNPEAASAPGSFMLSVPSPNNVDGQQEAAQEDSAVRAVLALRSQDEDATSSEEDLDEFPEDDSIQDDISVSFDELRYVCPRNFDRFATLLNVCSILLLRAAVGRVIPTLNLSPKRSGAA